MRDYAVLYTSRSEVLFRKEFKFVVDDVHKTHNINMHSFRCSAFSLEEALGKMYLDRPEFRHLKINNAYCDGELTAIG